MTKQRADSKDGEEDRKRRYFGWGMLGALLAVVVVGAFVAAGTNLWMIKDSGEVSLQELAAGLTSDSGYVHLYAKTDGKLYSKDDVGTEYDLTAGASSTNAFGTHNAPVGTDPVADSTTDTLNLTSTGASITITGDSATDTLNYEVAADGVTEAMLKAVDAAGDEECLTYESTVGDFEWQTCAAGATTFLGLTDTPATYVGQGGLYTRVNVGETGLEFGTPAGAGDITAVGDVASGAAFDGTQGSSLKGVDGTAGGDLTVSAGDGTTGLGGAMVVEAGTSNSGVQGTFQIIDSWNGTATVNGIVCSTAASSTVADCTAGSTTGIIGVALTASTPVKVVTRGTSLVNSDNVAAVGDNFCMSKTVAAQGHANGAATCPPGTVIGIVRSVTELTALGQATTTLPLVSLGPIPAGQAGSTGSRIVTTTPDAIVETDNGGLVIYNTGSSAATIACPTAAAFQEGWRASVKSIFAGPVTITATGGCYIDTVALTTITLPIGFGAVIESDGTNFYTHRTFGAGTSGGIPYFSALDVIESTAVLPAGDIVVGGGAGAAPTTITPNAGTDVTADLEEEAHNTEHAIGGADINYFRRTILWYYDGTVATGTEIGPTVITDGVWTVIDVIMHVKTSPTGATLIVDINEAGTTLFTTRPEIDISGTREDNNHSFNDTSIASGAEVTFDVDQVGSTIAGADLTVELIVEQALET